MKQFCIGCGKEHEHHNWRFDDRGWICGKFFSSTKIEWVPNRLKEDRVRHAKDIVQPWRGGDASKEFIKQYPEKAKEMFTPQEIKNAKNVWKDLKGLD